MKLPWVSRIVHEEVQRIVALYRELLAERQTRVRELEARCDALVMEVARLVRQTTRVGAVVPDGAIPDPPSVSAADAKVAVALRDREAAPLKRPLRPGEDA